MSKEELLINAKEAKLSALSLRLEVFLALAKKYVDYKRFDNSPIELDDYEVVAVSINVEDPGDSYLSIVENGKRGVKHILASSTPVEDLISLL